MILNPRISELEGDREKPGSLLSFYKEAQRERKFAICPTAGALFPHRWVIAPLPFILCSPPPSSFPPSFPFLLSLTRREKDSIVVRQCRDGTGPPCPVPHQGPLLQAGGDPNQIIQTLHHKSCSRRHTHWLGDLEEAKISSSHHESYSRELTPSPACPQGQKNGVILNFSFIMIRKITPGVKIEHANETREKACYEPHRG